MNILDRFIGWISPRAGLDRARFRAAIPTMRAYEAASRGRRLKGWNPTNADANANTLVSLDTLRARHRDLVDNNAWCKRAVNAIVNNTVGTGIIGEIKSPNAKKAPKLNAQWRAWASSTACDFDGAHDFSGLQALAVRTLVASGECLIRRSMGGDGPIPLQLQVLEPDHLDSSKNEPVNGNTVIQGVEFDASGKRVAYWIFPKHPGGQASYGYRTSERRDARDFIHLRRVERPGQVRGVPRGVSVIVTIRDHDGYEDAFLVRQKVAACFAGFVYDTEAGTAPEGTDTQVLEKIEPGAIEVLPPGKSIEFGNPPKADDYGPFTRAVLHKIAAGFDVPAYVLTGDLSEINYSSGRMGWLEFQRSIEHERWVVLVPQLLNRVGAWFLEALPIVAGAGVSDGAYFDWTPPRREIVDPAKEIPALIDGARGGIISMPEIHRQMGYDSAQVIAEAAEFNAQSDAAGVKFDSDGRNAAKGAQSQSQNDTGNAANQGRNDAVEAVRAITDTVGKAMESAMAGVAEAVRGIKAPDVKVDLNPQFQLDFRPRAMKRTVTATDADGVATEITETPIEDAQ